MSEDNPETDLGIYISAPNKTFIGITNAGNLVVGSNSDIATEIKLDFGPATSRNFSSIIEYFSRLAVHATDYDIKGK